MRGECSIIADIINACVISNSEGKEILGDGDVQIFG